MAKQNGYLHSQTGVKKSMFDFFLSKKKDAGANIVEILPIEHQPKYNLIFHFHCIDHEKVWYAIEKIEQHINIFTGYKIFTLSSANNRFINNKIFNTIVNKFKNYNNVYFMPVSNSLETRETAHFFEYAMPLLIQLADMPNTKSYTFYGHSKGCTRNPKDYAITCWVNTLYKYNLELFDTLVKPNLESNNYKFVGCLKTNVGSTHGAKYHYSGTFFWFDSDIVRGDWLKYMKHVLGLEMWPNTIVDNSEMLSVFDLPLDANSSENYYRVDFWNTQVFNRVISPPITFKTPTEK